MVLVDVSFVVSGLQLVVMNLYYRITGGGDRGGGLHSVDYVDLTYLLFFNYWLQVCLYEV